MMGWDVRDNINTEELYALGARLSIEIDCPVRYPAYDKGIFECMCKKTFPVFLLQGHTWGEMRNRHKEE